MIILGSINSSMNAIASKPSLANRHHAGVNRNVKVHAIINCSCF